jgi:hypothetical protein
MWRGGCIIRSRFLGRIKEAFKKNPALVNLLLDDFFLGAIQNAQVYNKKQKSLFGKISPRRIHGAMCFPLPSNWAFQCRHSAPHWPSLMAIGQKCCRPICCRFLNY